MSSPIRVTLTTLHCLPIFRNIPDLQLEILIPVCKAQEYDQGEIILSAGEVSTNFYILLSGSIRVVLKRELDGSEGREKEVLLAHLQSGDFFGELSMIDAAPRSANVIAESDCCVVSIGGEDFRNVIRRNVDITFYMLRNLAGRLRQSDDKIRSFALQDVASRVLLELESIARAEGTPGQISQRISRQELAKRIGASREMVGRAMRELEVSGQLNFLQGNLMINKT